MNSFARSEETLVIPGSGTGFVQYRFRVSGSSFNGTSQLLVFHRVGGNLTGFEVFVPQNANNILINLPVVYGEAYDLIVGFAALSFGPGSFADFFSTATLDGIQPLDDDENVIPGFQSVQGASGSVYSTTGVISVPANDSGEQVENLIGVVQGLVADGKLKSAHARLLTQTLEAAIRSLKKQKSKVATLLLKGFVVEVRLLVRLRRLAAVDGQTLRDGAEGIIAEIRSP
jgi:hypothetical protein